MMFASDLIKGKYYVVTEGIKEGYILKFVKLNIFNKNFYNRARFIDEKANLVVILPFNELICVRELTPLEEELL